MFAQQVRNRFHGFMTMMRQHQGLLANRSTHFFNIKLASIVLLAQAHGGMVITLVHAVALLGDMEQTAQCRLQQTAFVQQTVQSVHLLTHKRQMLGELPGCGRAGAESPGAWPASAISKGEPYTVSNQIW